MRTHSGEKQFVCKDCTKSFTFVCKECSMSFWRKVNYCIQTVILLNKFTCLENSRVFVNSWEPQCSMLPGLSTTSRVYIVLSSTCRASNLFTTFQYLQGIQSIYYFPVPAGLPISILLSSTGRPSLPVQ